jgi:hypothetical protein
MPLRGLSRRRSRVRVPSLPLLEVPANRHFLLPVQTQDLARWPNPVAQTPGAKCLQNGNFLAELVYRPHGLDQVMSVCVVSEEERQRAAACGDGASASC